MYIRSCSSRYEQAMLHFVYCLLNFKPFDENYRCTDIKEGSQTKNRYVELIKLRYTFKNKQLDYMNFTIDLVIGKKVNGMHVQYSLEYIKKRVVNPCRSRSTRF